MEEKKYNNNIIQDAYYLISLFNNNNKTITQLQVQKLMYLFEAYYLNVKNVDRLYECEYQAWNFGPVATPLYKTFKKYGRNNIILTEQEKSLGNNISEDKKKLLNDIYNVFGNFTAMELVNFTHADGSPWKEAWEYREYSNINKERMKSWFSKYVTK